MKEAVSDKDGREQKKPYDLSEESSLRDDPGATELARKLENDDVPGTGQPSEPSGISDNKVWTSSSDE